MVFPDYDYRLSFIIKPGEYRLPKFMVEDPFSMLNKYMVIKQILETKSYIMIRYSEFE